MKRYLLFVVIPLLAGCHSISVSFPNGAKASVSSIGQRVTIGNLSFSTNGVISVTNYNNDQVAGLQAAFAAGLQAASKAALP